MDVTFALCSTRPWCLLLGFHLCLHATAKYVLSHQKTHLTLSLRNQELSFLWKQLRVQRGAKEKMEALVSSGWELADSHVGGVAGNVIPQTVV